MLEIQLGIPRNSKTTIGEIKPGTVFFGSSLPDGIVRPHLKLTFDNVVNLTTMDIWSGHKNSSPIYNYTEITDAILTRSSCCSLFDTLHPTSTRDFSVRDKKE